MYYQLQISIGLKLHKFTKNIYILYKQVILYRYSYAEVTVTKEERSKLINHRY